MAGANDCRPRCSRVSFLLLHTRVQNVRAISNSKHPSPAEQPAIRARWFGELWRCQIILYREPCGETYLGWDNDATGTTDVEVGEMAGGRAVIDEIAPPTAWFGVGTGVVRSDTEGANGLSTADRSKAPDRVSQLVFSCARTQYSPWTRRMN